MRLLDLFCGRWGWSRAFAARGWECVGVDLCELNEVDKPNGAIFLCSDVRKFWATKGWIYHTYDCDWSEQFDFIVASPPCENFSVWGMKHFHPSPPWPHLGITLFNHTRTLCEMSGLPYVIENVRAAQQFVGNAVHHCGPFYLWGNGVPPLMPQGILKGRRLMAGGYKGQTGIQNDKKAASIVATIPLELANAVATYAENLLTNPVDALKRRSGAAHQEETQIERLS